jgi:uncharacterized membrane protein YhaH (DUF805 family)
LLSKDGFEFVEPMLTFPDAVRTCLTKYAVFNGRATRSEYWFFVLFAFLVVVAASIFDGILNMVVFEPAMGGNMLASLAMLALLLPQLAAAVRRLHDLGHSGWWYLIGLVPVVGGAALLIWFCLRGTEGENRFGPDPLGFESEWAPEQV